MLPSTVGLGGNLKIKEHQRSDFKENPDIIRLVTQRSSCQMFHELCNDFEKVMLSF